MRTGTIVAVLLLLPGCAAGDPSPTSIASPPPAGVKNCGTHVIEQGDGLPAEARACFTDALKAGVAAQLEETRPTIEGDPIFTRYVSRTDGTVEVVRDTRMDDYGPRGISVEICQGSSLEPHPGNLIFAQCQPAMSK